MLQFRQLNDLTNVIREAIKITLGICIVFARTDARSAEQQRRVCSFEAQARTLASKHGGGAIVRVDDSFSFVNFLICVIGQIIVLYFILLVY